MASSASVVSCGWWVVGVVEVGGVYESHIRDIHGYTRVSTHTYTQHLDLSSYLGLDAALGVEDVLAQEGLSQDVRLGPLPRRACLVRSLGLGGESIMFGPGVRVR